MVQPKPQYSIQTLTELIKQGIHPEIGGWKVGFVPFKPPPKEGEKKAPRTEIIPLPQTPGADLYLPVAEGLVVTRMMAWKVPGTSEEGNELIEIYFPEWEKKYGVNTFTVDAKTGQMYIFKNNKLQQINERCSTKPIVGEEIMSVTPSAGLGFGTLIVETPGSSAFRKATPPPAESTRKLKGKGVKQPAGESYLEGTLDMGMSLTPKTLYIEEHEGDDNKLGDTPELDPKQSEEYVSRSSEETDPEALHTNLTSELSQHSISSTSAGEELEGESLIKTGRDDAFDLTKNQKEQKLA